MVRLLYQILGRVSHCEMGDKDRIKVISLGGIFFKSAGTPPSLQRETISVTSCLLLWPTKQKGAYS